MKFSIPNSLTGSDARSRRNHRMKVFSLLSCAALILSSPAARAAKPGGTAVLLPPFVYTPAPSLSLPVVSPFDMIGFIQSATVDTPGDIFSGGSLEVNGVKVTVPRNTIFQMPATQ